MSLIPFGKVTRTHGLRGEIKIIPFSHSLENLSRLKRIFIQKKGEEKPHEFKVISRKFHKDTAIVELEGIESVEAAERLRGCLVLVESTNLVETEEDEYYWFQLIGLRVYTTQGRYVGRVENLIERAQECLLVVKEGDNEFLIPMVDAIVKEITLENSQIVVFPLSGLID